jgi:hypothetical protein
MARNLAVKGLASGVGNGWCSGCAESPVLGVVLLLVLDLCVMTPRSAILDVVMDVDVGVDVLVDIIWQRLIDLLVGVTVAASITWLMRGRPS